MAPARVRGVGAGVTMHMAQGFFHCATLGSVCIGMGSLLAFAGMPRLFQGGGGATTAAFVYLHWYECAGVSAMAYAVVVYIYICVHPWVRPVRAWDTNWAWEPA